MMNVAPINYQSNVMKSNNVNFCSKGNVAKVVSLQVKDGGLINPQVNPIPDDIPLEKIIDMIRYVADSLFKF